METFKCHMTRQGGGGLLKPSRVASYGRRGGQIVI